MKFNFDEAIKFAKEEIQKIRIAYTKTGESGGKKYPKFGQRIDNSGYSKKR